MIAGAISAVSIIWMINEIKIQKAYDNYCSSQDCGEEDDLRIYNVLFFKENLWTDDDKASDLINELADDCDVDCRKAGCRWSVIYTLNAVTAVLYSISNMILVFGTWLYNFRIVGVLCQLFLILLSITTVTTTGVFRFNTMG